MKKLNWVIALAAALLTIHLSACADAIKGTELRDGTYEITVDSSASMFRVVGCVLEVSDGQMTARITMSGKGYGKLFLGKAEAAANAREEECIPALNENDAVSFILPIEMLDAEMDCAAYSIRKDAWYDRVLVFRSEGIPLSAFCENALCTASSLGLEDGEYAVAVSLKGGSGKARIASPAIIRVNNGESTAVVEMSSNKYDYIRIDEQLYYPINTSGNSTFEIPVLCFDRPMIIYADTTAMSVPHEIEYALTFASEGLK